MIDTEKYEGHTEGPWEIIEREVPDPQWDVMLSCPEVGKFASIQGSNGWRPTEVELELIADAPLLLAEVKQFHAFDEYMRMLRNGQIDVDDICDVWDEIRKEREE